MRTLVLLLLAACSETGKPSDTGTDTAADTGDTADTDTGEPSAACDELPDDAPPVTIVVVDEAGAPVAADRVRWSDPATLVLWDDAALAACAEGEPPCSAWALPATLPDRVIVAADRRDEAADPADRPTCMAWAAIATRLYVDPARPQLVHLTLPSDALWCDDGATFGPENVGRFEVLDDGDCLAAPPSAEGPLTVDVVELDGSASSADRVQWYHPPDGPDYDGDHDLACVDPGCATWVGADAPTAGDYYVAAIANGPPVPDYLAGVFASGFGAGLQTAAEDLRVEVALEWSYMAFDAR